MKKLSVLLLVVTFIFVFVACDITGLPEQTPKDNQEDDNNINSQIKPRKGGTLSLAVQGIDTWNPLLAKTSDAVNFLGLIYEGVVGYDKDLSKIPVLASDWNVSDDGRLWTFNIRKDAVWHNGEELTAEDVIFTFNILKSGILDSFYEHNIYENDNILEIGLKSNDKYSFFIRLAEPSSKLLDLMTFPVLSKEYFETAENMLNNQYDLTSTPIGTGPYKAQDDFLIDEKVVRLVRNEVWWGVDPYIDKIEGKIYSNRKE
ncbi:MAG TPA: ABC transporter substrate-binding protein, partial [Bacillota bacterium]|nr:ABC transporter substrate-binding protein [Bacillota bacterium]